MTSFDGWRQVHVSQQDALNAAIAVAADAGPAAAPPLLEKLLWSPQAVVRFDADEELLADPREDLCQLVPLAPATAVRALLRAGDAATLQRVADANDLN
jgi:hypothetical protein